MDARSAKIFILGFGLCLGAAVQAQDAPLSNDDFKARIVGQKVRVQSIPANLIYDAQFHDGGRAVIAKAYNDVGRWRAHDPAGYCTIWNKQAPEEKCYVLMQREGRLAIHDAAGKHVGWMDPIR